MLSTVAAVLLALVTSSSAATLKFTAPAGWKTVTPSSSMRVAEFALPKVSGDTEDASLVVYFFGGSGGTVQANIDRWIGQMTQPDGRPSKSVATTTTMAANGLKVTLIDLSGTYTAEMSPGAADHFNKPNFRLCAAYVDTPGGPYYIKLTGPAPTVEHWHKSFIGFLASLKFS